MIKDSWNFEFLRWIPGGPGLINEILLLLAGICMCTIIPEVKNAPGVTVKLKIGLKWENSLSGFLLPGT